MISERGVVALQRQFSANARSEIYRIIQDEQEVRGGRTVEEHPANFHVYLFALAWIAAGATYWIAVSLGL